MQKDSKKLSIDACFIACAGLGTRMGEISQVFQT